MLDSLFLNFCVLCTCAYALSVTFRHWPVERRGPWHLLRLALLAGMTALLMAHPFILPGGVHVDMRAVPTVFAALRYGALAGVIAAAPMLAVPLTGGMPLHAAAFLHGPPGVLATLLTGLAVRAGLRRVPPERRRALRLPGAALTLGAATLPELMVSGGSGSSAATLPGWLLSTAGYVLLHSIVLSRIGQMKATSRWQSQAMLDTLTGLANRRQFDQDLVNLDDGDAVLAVDIDHFKRVNDTHGHETGDRVLRAVGEALQGGLRHHDRAYRLGGEEFAVLLRHVTRDQAQAVAERLRRAVEARTMAGLQVTISVGVSTVAPGEAPAAVKQADVALYRAKQRGRNRTCTWQSGDLTALDVTKTIIGLM